MSSHFDFENEVNNLLKLDAPIRTGPTPRWQRKAREGSRNCSFASLSPLKVSNCSLNQSTKTPNTSFMTTSKASSKTPGKSKTPNKSLSLNKTPSRSDRYIPNRNATNFELGQYKFTGASENWEGEGDTPSKEEYQRMLKENMGQTANPDGRILAFRDRPAAAEGYENGSKVLYSSTKKNTANRKKTRHIPSHSERVLDAPQLLNDFYLNLIDWSSSEILAVALGECVYLFNTATGDIQLLFTMEEANEYICSLRWVPDGRHIAIGTSSAEVQVWDVAAAKRLRNMTGHAGRVGALCWNDAILSSGSRDCFIHHHDVRVARHLVNTYQGHTQEVCGLEWSPDLKYLASGGNDNIVNVWDDRESNPTHTFTDHQSAVKALAWCPWQPNLLATGGGSADRHIRFWNGHLGTMTNSVDAKSQVCALKWSKHYKELVSSHGYSQNQLVIWSYPSLRRVQELMGHTGRVLFLAMSPDGSTVCSGAADETLRMWKCFSYEAESKKGAGPSAPGDQRKGKSMVAPFMSIR